MPSICHSQPSRTASTRSENAHLGQLGRRAASDLLDAERQELLLELAKLLGQVGLVLGDELVRANFAGGRHGEDYGR